MAETLQARREWHHIFKVMKGKNVQPGLLYLARISFRFDGEIKSFTDKQKLREFSSTTKPALQQMLKELLYVGNTREEKDLKKQTPGSSLVAQWLRICLPMQVTWVRALVWEDPTCRRATRPVSHNY